MTKGMAILKIFFYYIMLTLAANSIALVIGGGSSYQFAVLEDSPNFLEIIAYVWSLLKVFFGFFTFTIAGVPAVISLIFFWLPAVYVLLFIIGVIRGTN